MKVIKLLLILSVFIIFSNPIFSKINKESVKKQALIQHEVVSQHGKVHSQHGSKKLHSQHGNKGKISKLTKTSQARKSK